MSQSVVMDDLIDELLGDRSYHIEFNGHLTNHAKHAVVALSGLGARADRIKEYYDNYSRLTPYGCGLEPPRAVTRTITDDNWQDFFGQRGDFAAYCDFFDGKERELGVEEVLRRYVPPLLPGWVGSFTHAAIHLGWGLDAGSRWMTIEGLAYMAFSYVSCHPERSQVTPESGSRPVDSLLHMIDSWDEENDRFGAWVAEVISDTTSHGAAAVHPELARSGLQYRIARLLEVGHPSFYRAPQWLTEDIDNCWEELYYLVTLLYLAAPGDFIILHLITSLFGMEKIAEHLPADEQRYVLRCFWTGMFSVVLSEGRWPSRDVLRELHAAHGNKVDGPQSAGPTWEQIVALAVEEDEEHNPKMAFVLRQLWHRTGGRSIYRIAASHFTDTPQLPNTFAEPPAE